MSEALNVAPGTVKWLLNAARTRLRTLLGSAKERGMNKKSYSQILDAVAGDQSPQRSGSGSDTSWPEFRKEKVFVCNPRTKFVSAILLVVIVFVVLFYTVPADGSRHWALVWLCARGRPGARGTDPRAGRAGIRNPRWRHRHRGSGGAQPGSALRWSIPSMAFPALP